MRKLSNLLPPEGKSLFKSDLLPLLYPTMFRDRGGGVQLTNITRECLQRNLIRINTCDFIGSFASRFVYFTSSLGSPIIDGKYQRVNIFLVQKMCTYSCVMIIDIIKTVLITCGPVHRRGQLVMHHVSELHVYLE